MPTVTFKMPDEFVSRLDAAARRRGTTRSALLRDALESFLDLESTGASSAASLANDLIGAFKGPRDLSHHPRHMDGFGG